MMYAQLACAICENMNLKTTETLKCVDGGFITNLLSHSDNKEVLKTSFHESCSETSLEKGQLDFSRA